MEDNSNLILKRRQAMCSISIAMLQIHVLDLQKSLKAKEKDPNLQLFHN
jgi:hypothetical protein